MDEFFEKTSLWIGISRARWIKAVGQTEMGKESTAVAASAEKMGTIAQKVPFEKTVELQGGKFDA